MDRDLEQVPEKGPRTKHSRSKQKVKSQIRIKLVQQGDRDKARPMTRHEQKKPPKQKDTSYHTNKDKSCFFPNQTSKAGSERKIDLKSLKTKDEEATQISKKPSTFAQIRTNPVPQKYGTLKELHSCFKPDLARFSKTYKSLAVEEMNEGRRTHAGGWLGEEGGLLKITSEVSGIARSKNRLYREHEAHSKYKLSQTGKAPDVFSENKRPQMHSQPPKQVHVTNLILDGSEFFNSKDLLKNSRRSRNLAGEVQTNQSKYSGLMKPYYL